MINSVSILSNLKLISAISSIGDIKKKDSQEITNDISVGSYKSLLIQVLAMAEQEEAAPVGKKLNFVI
ncbi:MAG: hypothetical protein K6E29_02990 [Cyanobacteria bacterium RUI128]|nr:hypothetical protein [Cyanobacteria bacterium RUI128]